MQIVDPARLLSLRQRKRLSRPQLAERSKVNERTIQRLEKEPQPSRKNTLKRLATALGVKPGVLTGEEPLPESVKEPPSASRPPQIGAQVAPKVRLAYDLIKRRYGVSTAEIINMAPLFFALLAEGSLAWRREKLKELEEGVDRLEQIEGFWRGKSSDFNVASTSMREAIEAEKISTANDKADLFGEHLLDDLNYYEIDPSTDNPLASYLRKLEAELDLEAEIDITGVVCVDSEYLRFGSPLKFPDYDICSDELDSIANSSPAARLALEAGYARLSEIPEKLMAEDAGEERAKWLKDKLSDAFKDLEKEIKNLEKRMQDLEKEIKKKDDRIKEMVEMERPETYPEGVSEEEFWRERLKEFLKENKKQNEHREELGHLKEKQEEELGRLEMLITEEKGRILP